MRRKETELVAEMLRRIGGGTGHDRPITVLCAPPGFGKKQLIADLWKEEQSNGRGHFFDRIDHLEDPRSVSQAILEGDGAGAIFLYDLAYADMEYLSLALDRMVRTGTGSRVYLAMDDPSVLDLGRHRTAGCVEWVGPERLALGPAVLQAKFAKIGSVENRKRLAGIAGRWPIAAEMLVDWALRTTEPIRGFSDQDILQHTGLFEFIGSHVWDGLNDIERDALGRAALLSQPRSNLLSNGQAHERVMAKLSIKMAGLVEQSGEIFSLHPALSTFVREHGLLNDPQGQTGMMMELAERCSLQGELSDAARLAAAAGKPGRIAQIADQHGALLIWVLCGFSDLQSLVENAGENVIAQAPVLRMMRCIVDLKLGRISQAEAELQRLASESTIADRMKAEIEIIRVTLLVYGCSLARQHDIELLAGLLAQQSTEPAWQSFLATLSCILNSQRARFATAESSLAEARREAERAGSRYNLMFLFLHEAGIHIAQGALTRARSAIGAARKMWREEFASDIGVETVIAALSAKVEFETGRLTSARNALRKSANRLPDGEAWFDIYFAAYEPMARTILRERGLPKALEYLEAERATFAARGLGRVGKLLEGIGFCLTGEARLRSDDETCDSGAIFVPPDEVWSWQERETFALASAYDLEAKGCVNKAISLLEDANREASEENLLHSQLRYALALFLILHREGEQAKAQAWLAKIVALANKTGMRLVARDTVGAFVDHYSEELAESQVLDNGQLKTLAEIGRVRSEGQSTHSELSKREMDVIVALAGGGSDKEIARHLEISDHGVRYHLKNIFRKLGVHDRLAAVLAAKQKGWV